MSKGFRLGCADLDAAARHIVYPATARVPLDAETEAVSLAHFMADIARPG